MTGIIERLGTTSLSLVLFALPLIFLTMAGLILFFSKKQEEAVKEIPLSELSKYWTRSNSIAIHISELSPLWRNNHVATIEEGILPLLHPRTAGFSEKLQEWPWFRNFPQQRAVCLQLVKLLDQEGQCPSVVNVNSDVEGGWDQNTYSLLARTTLLDHSINVAEQAVQLLSEDKAWHVIPDTLIAALAHDLGKLESMRSFLYSLGEHPLASGRPLSGISGFKELPRKEEILQAVKLHHKRPQGLLGKTLKKADQLARQKELEEATQTQDAGQTLNTKPIPTKEKSNTKEASIAAWQTEADIFGENCEMPRHTAKSDIPKLMDISGWFDAGKFIDDLKPAINKMHGRRFLAFSMPDGYVYFQTKVLEELARKQAERAGCMEIAMMGPMNESMRNVLLTIVHRLKTEHEVIARGLIKDSFFGGYFSVTRKFGKAIKGYYTPFHAEAFGSIAEMEQAKPEILRDIVQVCPYLENEKVEG